MKKIATLMCVLMLMLASFTAGVEYQRGDVDQNGSVNIADVATLIDYLLTGTWNDAPVTPPDEHEWVDLGLPSGTLWATCNVGATSPEEYGDYFAWGETEPKEVYDWTTYKWCNGYENTLTKYVTNSSFGIVDNKTELDDEDDAAFINWGSSWHMPTKEQQDELRENCIWQWTQRNGVNGYHVIGPNGNSLFLSAAGSRYSNSLNDSGTDGYYWSCSLYYTGYSGGCSSAYKLNFGQLYVTWGDTYRVEGHTIRPVRVSQN